MAPTSYRQLLCLAAACGLVGLAPIGQAYAQSSGVATEEVVVTGSRLKRTDATAEAPITVVTAADIKRQGVQTVEQLLQRLPAVGTGGI